MDKNITQFGLNILNHQRSLASINNTFITLIPKIKHPHKVGDYKSINLCNVIYKIIGNVLANRLKRILHHIISPTQSAFIPNRRITNNILIAYEIMHTLNSQPKGNHRYMALKLVMSKAYDQVE